MDCKGCMKEATLKGYTWWDSVYITFWKKQNCKDREQISASKGFGSGELAQRGARGAIWGDSLFSTLILVVAT